MNTPPTVPAPFAFARDIETLKVAWARSYALAYPQSTVQVGLSIKGDGIDMEFPEGGEGETVDLDGASNYVLGVLELAGTWAFNHHLNGLSLALHEIQRYLILLPPFSHLPDYLGLLGNCSTANVSGFLYSIEPYYLFEGFPADGPCYTLVLNFGSDLPSGPGTLGGWMQGTENDEQTATSGTYRLTFSKPVRAGAGLPIVTVTVWFSAAYEGVFGLPE